MSDLTWASEAVLTGQRILIVCALVATICFIAVILTPHDERRRGR
jgi:hypothetical protein